MYRFKRVYISWTKLNPYKFILITGFVAFLSKLWIVPILYLFSMDEIGGVDFDLKGVVELVFLGIIFAPIVETFLSQYIPIVLFQKLLKRNANRVGIAVSVILFSLLHINYSIGYAIMVVPIGVILALSFVIFEKRKESSFWMTTFLHAFINMISLSFVIIEKLLAS
ncbi:CPBP family intramembrane glutamic endopeptidase [Ancylomarina euxinus]|nr:CPBP family intramembrane glutamic endopeptidase [Ancylomarina euxinus]MCZ4696036.1 CPBP family intramembrane metalloprotease [Ancylomarina euxinus]